MLLALALAAAEPQSYVTYGPARAVTCAEWTSLRGTAAGKEMQFWLLGFVTGYNYFAPASGGDIAGGLDAKALTAWADRHCIENPLDNQVQLGLALIQELKRRRR